MPMRPFDPLGSAASSSAETTFCCRTFCVSTSGAAPVTVIVSSSAPDLHVGVHRRGEPRRQLDAFPPERVEARPGVNVTT